MRHGIKLGKRGDGLTQVMKLLGQVFKNSRIRNIVLLFHHNLSNYPFGFPLRQCHSLQLGGRRGPRLVPGPAAAYVCSCRPSPFQAGNPPVWGEGEGPVGLKAGGFLGRSRLRLRKPRLWWGRAKEKGSVLAIVIN